MIDIEEWRAAPDWDGLYQVSSHGRVRSTDRTIYVKGPHGEFGWRRYQGRTLAAPVGNHGYPAVGFSAPGRPRKTYTVHSLVARVFHGAAPAPDMEVCHNDGVKTHCWASNLRWGTRLENAEDAKRHGHLNPLRGEASPRAKLNADRVREIRANVERISNRERARRLGVSHKVVNAVQHRESWAHIH